MRLPRKLQTAILLLILLGPALVQTAGSASAQDSDSTTFSGKAVPRFESLRYNEVNGRQGPSLQHKILWRYEQARLPVLIIRETVGWRRIRDSEGDEVWINARMLEDTRTLIVTRDTVLRRDPGAQGKPVAMLKAGLVLEFETCKAGWCHVSASGRTGYVDADRVWGKDEDTGGQQTPRVAAIGGSR